MVTEIITPKPTSSWSWGSLLSCCRPSTSPSPDDGIDDEEEDACSYGNNNNKSSTFDTETLDTSRDSVSRDTSEMSTSTTAQLLKEKDYVIESLRKQISEYSPYKKIKRGEEEETKEFYMLELEIILAEVSSLQLDLKLGRKTIDDIAHSPSDSSSNLG